MRRLVLLLALLVVAGCGDGEPAPTAAGSPGASAAAEGDLQVVRGLIEALNGGDSEAARAAFAPAARFDSVGRIYPDRDAIFSRFLDPEVIGAGGRYTERSARVEADRLVVEYDFTTRGGAASGSPTATGSRTA